jgi:hypothetical protein
MLHGCLSVRAGRSLLAVPAFRTDASASAFTLEAVTKVPRFLYDGKAKPQHPALAAACTAVAVLVLGPLLFQRIEDESWALSITFGVVCSITIFMVSYLRWYNADPPPLPPWIEGTPPDTD